MQSKIKPIEFLWYALYAFAVLGIEILIMVAPSILFGGVQPSEYSQAQKIIHLIITSLFWFILSYYLVLSSNKKLNFNVFTYNKVPARKNIFICIILVAVCVALNFYDWGNTLKIVGEFLKKGILYFVFQYIYYIFEIMPVVLIIVFGQKFFDSIFSNGYKLPWGGIVLGLTWGLVHTLTKGSIYTGLVLMIYSIVFGYIYLLCGKNIKYAYIFILLGFAI